jgi:DNA-binding MarR family transcriptional regulator
MREIVELIDEVRLLEHRLVQVAEALHGPDLSVPCRGVLEFLLTHDESTVPAIARARFVSRQHIQTVMDTLYAMGHVEDRENPAHRRSPLYALTAQGRRHITGMHTREAALMRKVFPRTGLSVRDIERSSRVLRAIRQQLEVA